MKKTIQERCSENRLFPAGWREVGTDFFAGNSGKAIMLVVLVFLLLYLPFISKPFHIDDVSFIEFSGLIGWNPLDSTPVDFLHDGKLIKNSLPPYEMTHPLLVPYVIKIVSALFGQNEVALHLSFILFPLLALVSIIKLYNVLFPDSKNSGAFAALFLCSMPAFLVNSNNIMTDVPTLSFLLLSLACYSLSVERASPGLAYLGGISLCVGAFISYQALFFIPVIFLFILVRKKLDVHSVLSLAIPVVALLVWFLLLYRSHGIFPLLKSRGVSEHNLISNLINMGLGYRELIRKGIGVLAFIGSSMLFLVPAYLFLNKSGLKFFLIFLPLAGLCYLSVFSVTGYSFFENAFLSLLISLGLLTLLIAVKESLMTEDEHHHKARGIFLISWVFLVIIYNVLIFPWVAMRYILPILPPLIMLLLNGLEWERRNKRKIIISSVIFLSVLFGLGSAYSDYKFAGTYRDFADDKYLGPRNNIWYVGAWGMKYYMEKTGARYLLETSNEPKEGDFVVIPEMISRIWIPSPELMSRLDLYATKTYTSPLPLRLFNKRSNAGFYSSAWGLLPFSVSTEPDEVIFVYIVVR